MTPDLTMALHTLSAHYPDARIIGDTVYLPSLHIHVSRPPAHRRQLHLQWQAVSVVADVCAETPERAVEALVAMLGGVS